ncbi:hypothetical protein [Streptomyces sp. SAS_270]
MPPVRAPIEQAIVRSVLARHPVGPVGYAAGYALAEEPLQLPV